MTISISVYKTLSITTLPFTLYLLLCWVSLCWMSLCWVSWRPHTGIPSKTKLLRANILWLKVVSLYTDFFEKYSHVKKSFFFGGGGGNLFLLFSSKRYFSLTIVNNFSIELCPFYGGFKTSGSSGLYYKHITMVNDYSSVIRMRLQIVASPTIVILMTL